MEHEGYQEIPAGADQEAGGDWFERAFGESYPEIYAHRDESEARRLVAAIRARYALAGPVLDVACGAGRLLRALHHIDGGAVGVDLSEALLRRARAGEGPPARLVRADMRRLPIRRESFAAAFFLFTSFGYFATRAQDRAALEDAAAALKPGGLLVLDSLNPRRVRAGLVPESERTVAGRRILERRWIDPSGPFVRKSVTLRSAAGSRQAGKTGPETRHEERVRLYEAAELQAGFRDAGIEPVDLWGDYDGGPFDPDRSPRLIVIGRKRPRDRAAGDHR